MDMNAPSALFAGPPCICSFKVTSRRAWPGICGQTNAAVLACWNHNVCVLLFIASAKVLVIPCNEGLGIGTQ